MPLTRIQVKQIEYLSMLKRITYGAYKEFLKWEWGNKYDDNIEMLKGILAKLASTTYK